MVDSSSSVNPPVPSSKEGDCPFAKDVRLKKLSSRSTRVIREEIGAGDGPDADGAEDGPVEEEAGIRQRLGFSRRDGRVCECVRVHVRASALCLCGEVAASMYHKAIEHAGIRRESEPSSGGFLSAQMPCIPKTPKGAKPKARHS